jgi:uncharacterized heparinase superfamily protein
MKPAAKIINHVRRGVQNAAYGNVLYQKILSSGDAPDRLHFTLADPWPGDAQAGLAMIATQRQMFDRGVAVTLRNMPEHLRNLRAVGTDAARHMALRLIEEWLHQFESWHESEWEPHILGERIAGWAGLYEFFAPAAAPEFIATITSSLHKQWKHLLRAAPSDQTGSKNIHVIRGLIYGGLNFDDSDRALSLACDLITRQLATEILPDGGHVSRNPSVHLHILKHIVELRGVFKAASLEAPEAIRTAIAAMTPVLKFFRHADGGLGLFHGGFEETSLLIDAVLMQAEQKTRNLRRLPQTGYERLTAGRSLLIADTTKPAPRGHDATAHAGLLSFEFGSGRERMFVNCGAGVPDSADWRAACAATAAHTTLSVEDTNAFDVLPDGIASASPYITAQRYEHNGTHCLEMTHDAYRSRFGLVHERLLGLSADGEALHGREILSGTAGKSFTLRWHLHPLMQASLMHSGQSALLRTPSGNGWRFQIDSGELGLEPSIYCGGGSPRRTLQLKASAQTKDAQTVVAWSLIRERKGG